MNLISHSFQPAELPPSGVYGGYIFPLARIAPNGPDDDWQAILASQSNLSGKTGGCHVTTFRRGCAISPNICSDRARNGYRAGTGLSQTRRPSEARQSFECSQPDEIPDVSSGRDRELVAIDDTLKTLAEMDPRKARVIELRFSGA
jgi:hypothetical protein